MNLFGQQDSISKKLTPTADFRFRIEQDWNSRKADGTYRTDRTRLRYRARAGFTYQHNRWASFGLRLRTGNPQKQQDPQITLGKAFAEFGTIPIGFEKLFFQAKSKGITLWFGKNTFPFQKQNELFWSDNVYPEGVFLSKRFQLESLFVESLKVSGGHFMVRSNGTSFDKDGYFQGFQISTTHWNQRISLFPSFYYFRNMPNIPDGNETFLFNYSIVHLGSKIQLSAKPLIHLEFDFYHNLENYTRNDSIPKALKDQKNGMIAALGFGSLQERGDLLLKFTYTRLEQYAAVDFLAQNDWARWDYSTAGSPDGRLTNFEGIEFVAGYAINRKLTLKMKYYQVVQIIPYGSAKETGSRIRFDVDIGF